MKSAAMLVFLAMTFWAVPHAQAQMEAKAATLAVYERQIQVDAARDSFCKAWLEGLPEAQKHYAAELKRAIVEYRSGTGRAPNLLPCDAEAEARAD